MPYKDRERARCCARESKARKRAGLPPRRPVRTALLGASLAPDREAYVRELLISLGRGDGRPSPSPWADPWIG